MFKKKFLLLLMALVLGLTACAGGGENTTDGTETEAATGQGAEETEAPGGGSEEQEPAGEPDADQYLNTFEVEEPTTLNSAVNSDRSSFRVLINVMEPLVRQVEDTSNGSITTEPAGAESWESSEDGLTWTFKIREGMTWSDGDPLTANDYEYGIKRALDAEDGAGGMGWLIDCIEGAPESMAGEIDSDEVGVTAVDDYTLEIQLNRPTPYFLQLCSTRPMLPIKQSAYEEFGEAYGAEVENIVTCGPFNLTGWTHQTGLTLEKNPDYWDAENVHFETVDWRILSEETTRLNAFQNGEIDTVGTNVAEWQAQFESKEDVFRREVKRPAVDFMFFNTEQAPYNNPKVRLAFSLAIDREEAIQAIYDGIGVPAHGFVMHGITTDDGQEYREVVPGPLEGLKEEYPDPKALLEEGLAEEGIDPAGFEVNLDFGGTGEQMKEVGDYFIQNFQENLGVTVNVRLNEWSAFNDQIQNGNFDIGYMAWFADYNDPYHMLSIMLSNNDGLQTRWANEEYDTLVIEGLEADSSEERLQKYEEAETILSEEAPVIPIFYSISNQYRYDYLYGWQDSEFSTQGLKYQFTSGR